MPDSIEEKREFIRVPLNTEVEVRVAGRSFRTEKGINISLRGLRCAAQGPLPAPGTPCRAAIYLHTSPDQQVQIEASATVVRSDDGNLAVEFIELDFDSYHHLRNLILNNAEDPARAEREFDSHWGIRRPGR